MNDNKHQTPRDSQLVMRELVMPNHTNPQNTIFGGIVMSWIDLAAAMCATRHAKAQVVTAHIDSIDFLHPVRVGHHVIISASLNYVGKTSMEVGVKVEAEDPLTGVKRKTARAYLTFVALDEFSRPITVPPLSLETEDEKRRFENAKQRVKSRKEFLQKIKSNPDSKSS